MQFWPRKRARRQYARVRSWPDSDKKGLLGFAGYKVGMTHVMGIDNRGKKPTAGDEIPFPVTVIECPPIRIASVRLYKKRGYQKKVADEFFVANNKELARKLNVPEETQEDELADINPEDYEDITVVVHTQPGKTNTGKKKPEVFEVHLGGNFQDKLDFIKDHIKQDIAISEIFEAGDLLDIYGITKGKGTQGPVKRFGIGLKPHKSEKGRRRPGSLGAWVGQQHFMYRVPMAGQTGYHQRLEENIQIFKMGDNPDEINVEGGYKKYGEVKSEYILVKGSVPGPAKRMVLFTEPNRPPKKTPDLPDITYISTTSKQGR